VAWEIVIFDPPPRREVCDFCAAESTHRLYACRNFMWLNYTMFAQESVGAWTACEECARLVDEGKWSELTERALAAFKRIHGYTADEEPYFREQFWELHQLFKEHMITEV
jgi:hypothetical protein